ncbi:MAG TPA: response regulator, partial [Catenuloplanes sp.]
MSWLVVPCVQVGTAVAFFVLDGSLPHAVLLLLFNALTVTALVVAARRDSAPTGWRVLGAAQVFNAGAWATWYLYPVLAGLPSPPLVGDVLFVASYVMSVVGLGLLARAHGADRRAVLDAAILATAVAVVLWVVLLAYQDESPAVAGLAAVIARAYVVLDLCLLAVAAALAFTARRWASSRLIFGWVALQLAGDSVFNVQVFNGTFAFGTPVFAWWLLSLGFLSAAALSPAPPRPAAPGRSWLRRLTVAAAVLALPTMLVVRSVQSSAEDVVIIAGGSIMVTVLAMARVLVSERGRTLPSGARAALRRSVVRLSAGFVALAILPLAGLTYLSVREAQQTVDAEVRRRLTTSADVTTTYLHDHLAGMQALTASYAERQLLAAALSRSDPQPAELQAHLTSLDARSPEFVGAWLVGPTGTMLAFDPPQPTVIGRDFGHRDYFRGPRDSGRPYVSEAFETALPGQPRVVAVSAPVIRAGRFLGVIAVGYRLEALRKFTDELAAVQRIDLRVADRRGTLLTGTNAGVTGLRSVARDEHIGAALAGQRGWAREVEDGVDTLIAYQPITQLGWAVEAEIPAQLAYAGASRFTGRILAVASLLAQVLLVGLVLAVRVERRRRVVEAELAEARDEALTASRLKSDFVANMSHEIRTPMNGVIGLTTLLTETHLDARQRDYVTTIESSADALLNVINEILDFSKIEAGMLALDPVDFDPRALAEEVVALIAASAHHKGLEIATLVHPAMPPVLRGDAHRIRQVLTNLVSNAVKFTTSGEVVIEVTVAQQLDDSNLCPVLFAVKDTGIGIPAERHHDLFEAFTQADTSTTRRYGGTGLGLTISRRLVDLMGGTIELHSEIGQGSTFHFTLPLRAANTAPRPEPLPGDLSGLPALIVDDNATNRQVLHDLLLTFGMRPVAVHSGPAALQALRTAADLGDPYQVALLDKHMPDMDGIQLANAIAAGPQAGVTRLAMLTSTDQSADVAAARAAGVEVYLTKPVRAAQLRSAILQLLNLSPTPAPAADADPGRWAPTPGTRVLVAEDNEVNQQVITGMLAALGYQSDTATDGQSALDMLRYRHYDAVLMDVQMPGMDGLEATRRIRQSPGALREIPVIALTASALASDEQRCMRAGMDHFLSKPIRKHTLAQMLYAAITKRIDRTGTGAVQRQTATPAPPGTATSTNADTGLTPEPEPPELDPASLAELREMGPAFLNRLVPSYLNNARATAAQMSAAAARADLTELARLAHKLRGSSGTLGGHHLAATCTTLEEAARALDTDRVHTLAATTIEETE